MKLTIFMRLAVHWIDDANPMDRWWPSSIRATGIGMEEAIAVVAGHRAPATGKSRTQKTKTEAELFVTFRACRSSNSYVECGTKSCRFCRIYRIYIIYIFCMPFSGSNFVNNNLYLNCEAKAVAAAAAAAAPLPDMA